MIKRRTQSHSIYEDFRRNLAYTVVSNTLSDLNADLDVLPIILEHIKTKVAIQAKLPGGVNCAVSTSSGVAMGSGSGVVGLISSSPEFPVLGQLDSEVICLVEAGDRLFAGSKSGQIVVWDLVHLSEIVRFEGHSEAIKCLAAIREGTVLISGPDSGDAKVWDVMSGLGIVTLEGCGGVSCLLSRSDGSALAMACGNGELSVWGTGNWQRTELTPLHNLMITALVGSPNGLLFCSSSEDSQIGVWRWSDKSLLATLSDHSNCIWSLTVTPDSSLLLSASADKTIKVWSLVSFTEVATMIGHKKEVNSVIVTPDSKFAVSAAADRTVRVWSLKDFKKVTRLKGHEGSIFALANCPDGSRFFSGGKDGSVRLWSNDNSPESYPVISHSACVNCVIISPDMKYVVSGSADYTVKVYNLSCPSPVRVLRGHKNWVTCLAVTSDSKVAVSGSDDTTVKVWNLETGQEIVTFQGHTMGINCLLVTPNGKLAVSGSSDHSAKVWKLPNLKLAATLTSHTGPVLCLAVTQDSKTLLSGSTDKTIKMWSMVSFTELRTFQGHTASVVELTTAGDLRKVISRAGNSELKSWDITEKLEISSIDTHRDITCLLCPSSGKYVITGHGDGIIRVTDMKSFEEVAVLYGHSQGVNCIRATNDSLHLVSGGWDNLIIAWSLEYMREVARYSHHTACIKDISVGSNGGFMVSASEDCSVLLTDLNVRVASVRKVILPPFPATLTEAGRNTFFGSAIDKLKRGKIIHTITASHLVQPYGFNALHVCAYFNNAVSLTEFLRCKVPIVRGSFGSPLTIAFKRNSRKCVDVILAALIDISENESCWQSLQEITADIPNIILSNSKLLTQFLTCVFRPSQQPFLPYFIIPRSKLPLVHIAPNWFVDVKPFQNDHSGLYQEVVDFFTSEFRWNFTSGSKESLELLTALESCNNRAVLNTPLIESLLHWKWRLLMPLTVALTVLFVGMLVCMIALVFEYSDAYALKVVFFTLNLFFLLYEGLQSYVSGVSYWKDPWNYIDWVRSVVCVVWIVCHHYSQYIDLLAVCMCFFRGFTYFRTFKMTRLFVRLTLEVVKEMYSFLIIFAYSTIAFGMMYAVLVPEQIDGAFRAWMTAYELLMGTYSTDGFHDLQWACFTFASLVNVIIMFNLLIAILGDAYEQAQMSAKENDTLEMLRIVIEYESMLFWRRNYGQRSIFSLCAPSNSAELFGHWGGKILEISSTVTKEINAKAEILAIQMDGNESKLEILETEAKKAAVTAAQAGTKVDTLAVFLENIEAKTRTRTAALEDRVRNVETGIEEIEGKLDLLLSHFSVAR